MQLPDLDALEAAAQVVYQTMQGSPQLQWPLLAEACGCKLWVKHENHNPTGAFKVRGGLLYLHNLAAREPAVTGLVSATRGNHGQSLAFAARRYGVHPVIVVPEGNSADKNRAMVALGAELVVHGADFDEAVPHAHALAETRGLHAIPSFHPDLVTGVGTYGLELLRAQPQLDRVYVPVGLGSGICGVASARSALGLDTEIVGVVTTAADAYARSFAAGEVVATDTADTFADGMAVRLPNAEALAIMREHVSRFVCVSDTEIAAAVLLYYRATHNVAEGAGAAPLAAALQEQELNGGAEIAVVLSGGNIDSDLYIRLLQDDSP